MHDMNGRPLSVGDSVLVPATITVVQATDEYCNISMETDVPMYPGTHKSTIALNAKQVSKVTNEAGAESEDGGD
jgi:hypothetical protein